LAEELEKHTYLRVCFADPHRSWQRPTNENTNGLLRQYFPKGSDLSQYSQQYLTKVANKMNNQTFLDFCARSEVLSLKAVGLGGKYFQAKY
jgi:IS30 family transposase